MADLLTSDELAELGFDPETTKQEIIAEAAIRFEPKFKTKIDPDRVMDMGRDHAANYVAIARFLGDRRSEFAIQIEFWIRAACDWEKTSPEIANLMLVQALAFEDLNYG